MSSKECKFQVPFLVWKQCQSLRRCSGIWVSNWRPMTWESSEKSVTPWSLVTNCGYSTSVHWWGVMPMLSSLLKTRTSFMFLHQKSNCWWGPELLSVRTVRTNLTMRTFALQSIQRKTNCQNFTEEEQRHAWGSSSTMMQSLLTVKPSAMESMGSGTILSRYSLSFIMHKTFDPNSGSKGGGSKRGKGLHKNFQVV